MQNLPSAISNKPSLELIPELELEFGFSQSEIELAKELISKGLPPIVRPEILAYTFGISNRFIYSMYHSIDLHYKIYTIPKATGGTRQIEAPRRYLKLIQRWININILATCSLPNVATGFVKGQSIFTNAIPHIQNKNLMVIDLKNFFPTVSRKQVYQIFKSLGYPQRVNNLMTGLCTYKSRLPQGAPTSPTLANIAFKSVDLQLLELAKSWGCTYTRYADDIAFSGNICFTHYKLLQITSIIKKSGFVVNMKKTRIVGDGARQMLAGLVINRAALPPREDRRRWRAIFHQASLDPNHFANDKAKLKGVASFINQYNPKIAREYWVIANNLPDK